MFRPSGAVTGGSNARSAPPAQPDKHVDRSSQRLVNTAGKQAAHRVQDENANPFEPRHEQAVIPDSDDESLPLLGSDPPGERRTTTRPPGNATDERSSGTTASVSMPIDQKSSESLERELNTLKLAQGKVCNDILSLVDKFDGTEDNMLQQTLLRQNKNYLDSRIATVEAELARRAAAANKSPLGASTSSSSLSAGRPSDPFLSSHAPPAAPVAPLHVTPHQSTSRFFHTTGTPSSVTPALVYEQPVVALVNSPTVSTSTSKPNGPDTNAYPFITTASAKRVAAPVTTSAQNMAGYPVDHQSANSDVPSKQTAAATPTFRAAGPAGPSNTNNRRPEADVAVSNTNIRARDTAKADEARLAAQHELADLPLDLFDDGDVLDDDDGPIEPIRNNAPLLAPRPAVAPFAAAPRVANNATVASSSKGKERAVDAAPSKTKNKPGNAQHPWTRDIYKTLRQRFGLQAFREHQEEAINATLSGRDVFVLLPTGGGKSLCFQLPACITTGTTRGVTIVVSPLLSLIEDQTAALFRKDIPTVFLNSTMKAADRNFVMRMLSEREPPCLLAYVTPEQINRSQAFKNTLARLHQNGRLARFVIDEAHCVSSWGHDFRPDYKELGCLKRDFPDIPVIALTATATGRVQQDIVATLGMRAPLQLQRSFNRPNLKYEVRTKTKSILEEIAKFIRAGHNSSCGIIYCSSQKQCEDTADKLRRLYRISAKHYHAGMDKVERSRIQRGWQDGEFHVICATIAFGMGIDKPDVRFVIHFTLSQSLEAYYQETGRAGRDGETSTCVLFFSYADTKLINRLIDEGEGTREQKDNNKANVKRMVAYCMNTTDCRRKQVLSYFGENDFDEADCHKTCDNCLKGVAVEKRDVTDLAKDAISLVMGMGADKVTMLHATDVFRGSRTKKIVDAGHADLPQAGKGASLERGDVERLFQLLALESAFGERYERNALGFTSAYITVGPRAQVILSGKQRIMMSFSDKSAAKSQAERAGNAKGAAKRQLPLAPTEEIDLLDDDDDEFYEELDVEAWRPAARRRQTPALKDVPDEVLLGDIHQKCYDELRAIRDLAAIDDDDMDAESLFPDVLLQEIALKLPETQVAFEEIDGMTTDRWLFVGESKMLRTVMRYRQLLHQVKEPPRAQIATVSKPGTSAPVTSATGKKRSSDEAFRGMISNFAAPTTAVASASSSKPATVASKAKPSTSSKVGGAFRSSSKTNKANPVSRTTVATKKKASAGSGARTVDEAGLRNRALFASVVAPPRLLAPPTTSATNKRHHLLLSKQRNTPSMTSTSVPINRSLQAVQQQDASPDGKSSNGNQRSQSLPPPTLPRPPKRRTQEYGRAGAEQGYAPDTPKLTTFSGVSRVPQHQQEHPAVNGADWQGKFWNGHTDAPLLRAEQAEVLDRVKHDMLGNDTVAFAKQPASDPAEYPPSVDVSQQHQPEHGGELQSGQQQVQLDQHDEASQVEVPTQEQVTNAIVDAQTMLQLQGAPVNGASLFQPPPPHNDPHTSQIASDLAAWASLPPIPQGNFANPYALPGAGQQSYYQLPGPSNGRSRFQYEQPRAPDQSIEAIPVDQQYIAAGLDEAISKATDAANAHDGEQTEPAEPPKKKARRPRPPRNDDGTGMAKCDAILPSGEPCTLAFKRPYDLARHKLSVHSEQSKKKEWKCGQCGNAFSRKDAVLRHCRIRGHASGLDS